MAKWRVVVTFIFKMSCEIFLRLHVHVCVLSPPHVCVCRGGFEISTCIGVIYQT